jgi:hypothetical protein
MHSSRIAQPLVVTLGHAPLEPTLLACTKHRHAFVRGSSLFLLDRYLVVPTFAASDTALGTTRARRCQS